MEDEFLPLPFEARALVYKKLDPKSILQFRLLNSKTKDEIDNNIGLSLRVPLKYPQESNEILQKLLSIKIHSVQFIDPNEVVFPSWRPSVLTFPRVMYPSTQLSDDIQFAYPLFVRTVTFGSQKQNQCRGLTSINQGLILNVLRQCPWIQSLSFVGVNISGYVSTPEQILELESALNGNGLVCLRELCVILKPNNQSEVHHAFPSIISSFLLNCNLPTLTSITLVLYSHPSPWTTSFQLIARHWTTIKRVKLDLARRSEGLADEDWSWTWGTSPNEVTDNLKKIRGLTHFSIDGNFAGLSNADENDFSTVRDCIVTVIRQQVHLQVLSCGMWNFFSYETLKEIIEVNSASLRALDVANLIREPEDRRIIIDMGNFSSCPKLKEIKISFTDEVELRHFQGEDPRNLFKVTNLESVPEGIKELTLIGFSFYEDNGMDQLQNLSQRCTHLTKVILDLESLLLNISGLTPIIVKLIRNCESLEYISLTIRKVLTDDPEILSVWEDEWLRLDALFGLFPHHERSIICKSRDGHAFTTVENFEPVFPEFPAGSWHCTLTAGPITPKNRTNVLKLLGSFLLGI